MISHVLDHKVVQWLIDYCFISHDCLTICSKFKVTRVLDLIKSMGTQQFSSIPDHSVISWKYTVNSPLLDNVTCSRPGSSFTKFKVDSIPHDFMTNTEFTQTIHECVFNLEESMRSQIDIDASYQSLCTLIQTEMKSYLPCKPASNSCRSNKRRRIGKPWWCDALTNLWNLACAAEKAWLSNSVKSEQRILKLEMFLDVKILTGLFKGKSGNGGLTCSKN